MPTLAVPNQKPKRRLTTRQREFVKEYVSNGFNARKATLTSGYSKNAAVEQGSHPEKISLIIFRTRSNELGGIREKFPAVLPR